MKLNRKASLKGALIPGVAVAGLALTLMTGSGTAGADSGSGTTNNNANGSATGTGGPIHDAVEEFGQSLCPKLVKPGSDLATAVSEAKGNSGLTPTLTGMVAGLAIQLECPAFMSSLADGKLPAALQQANNSPVAPLLQAGNSPAAPLLQIPGLGASPAAPKKN